ncbi:hypothetical protein [Lacticaseibacillus suilingensis]|uniref:hypothetical protein n=1 Tax=Lacticaseibacillus suilingensis TaxID=2799577 RepID=UPI0022E6A398|nr:hypothetical protein [Lacticaseibacillus suilingensis]
MKLKIGSNLTAALSRTDGTQRWLAAMMGKGKSSVNNYVNNSPVSADDAVSMAHVLDDDQFSQELGSLMLGLIKSFTGSKIPTNMSSLLDYDDFEEDEEKRYLKVNHVRMILANPEELSEREREDLISYLFEKLDSTMMDLTVLTAGADRLGTTLAALLHERMPTYVKMHYVRREDMTWSQKR